MAAIGAASPPVDHAPVPTNPPPPPITGCWYPLCLRVTCDAKYAGDANTLPQIWQLFAPVDCLSFRSFSMTFVRRSS
jgi:hypothetical protein